MIGENGGLYVTNGIGAGASPVDFSVTADFEVSPNVAGAPTVSAGAFAGPGGGSTFGLSPSGQFVLSGISLGFGDPQMGASVAYPL